MTVSHEEDNNRKRFSCKVFLHGINVYHHYMNTYEYFAYYLPQRISCKLGHCNTDYTKNMALTSMISKNKTKSSPIQSKSTFLQQDTRSKQSRSGQSHSTAQRLHMKLSHTQPAPQHLPQHKPHPDSHPCRGQTGQSGSVNYFREAIVFVIQDSQDRRVLQDQHQQKQESKL